MTGQPPSSRAQPFGFPIANPGLVALLEPFVVVAPFNRPMLELAPYGWRIPAGNVIDPLRLGSEPFLAQLQRLDGLTFGPEGMPMDRWVFYDCAELPGAIYGLGIAPDRLWPWARDLLDLPRGYSALVPLSMYIAIPMRRPGTWFGHNLASLGPVLRSQPGCDVELRGLGALTKALAFRCFGIDQFWGATQWLSRALFIHTKFGPLDLQTAYTPAHTESETLTYGFRVTDEKLRASMGDTTVSLHRPEPTRWIDGRDVAAMQSLQDELEAGARYCVPGPPVHDERGVRVPIAALD
jgi:hypothetical protein